MLFRPKAKDRGLILGCACLVALGICIVYIKFHFYSLDYTDDYVTYITTAKFISGIKIGTIPDQRLLKPIEPFLTALLNTITHSFDTAFFTQVVIFYILLIPTSFLFFAEFFRKNLFLTIGSTSLFMFGYPMLRFGLDPFTEGGAWFFYMLSLLFTLYFLRKPQEKFIWLNAAVSTLGFLYKEYSIVAYFIANLVILFMPELKKTKRKKYLLIYNGLFIGINVLWQAIFYLKFNYSYVLWYIQGGLTGSSVLYHWRFIIPSIFALLLFGWIFIPGAALAWQKYNLKEKLFVGLLLTIPCICFAWGSVSSRLFYVLGPGLVIVCVIGIDSVISNRYLKYAVVACLIVVNFIYLSRGGQFVF